MAETELEGDITVPRRIPLRQSLGKFGKSIIAFLLSHRRALAVAGGLVAVFLIFGTTTVVVSQQPGFCVNCHEIRPAYDQWRASSHYGVTCVNCHTEPGLSGYVKINLVGAQHLVTHLVSDYRLPTEADVRDSSCLGCHPRNSLPEESLRTTLRVDHSKHDKEQCSDCHGRLVHLNGADEISTAPKAHDVRDCTVCHTPEKLNPHGYATLACTSCHSGIIPGHEQARLRGVMPRASCQECHQKNRVGSPEYCQTCHVSPHGISVPCSRCHTSSTTWTEHTFNHPVALTGQHANVECASCHAQKPLASMKYVCSTCHMPPTPHPGTVNGSTGDCANCHSPDGWKVAMPTQLVSSSHNGRTNCLACHTNLTQPALPKDHTGRTDDTCKVCHKIAPAPPATATPAAAGATNQPAASSSGGPKALPADHAGRTVCVACHANGAGPALPADHAGRTDATCTACHKTGSAPAVSPTGGSSPSTGATPTTGATAPATATRASSPTTAATSVTSPTAAASTSGPAALPADHAGRTTCLMCHANGMGPALPADHAGRQDATCTACHKPR